MVGHGGERRVARILMAWDAPNIDMTLSQFLDHRPGPADRPDMRAVMRWLRGLGEPQDRVEASVFINVPPERPKAQRDWAFYLQGIGYRVFAKPKANGSDIDEEMQVYLRSKAPGSSHVVVASNDANAFVDLVEEMAGHRAVIVVGFEELAGALATPAGWTFVDLADIPQVLPGELPRTRFGTLGPEGGWFEPRQGPPDQASPDDRDEEVGGANEPTA
jgi:uncharacterized protein